MPAASKNAILFMAARFSDRPHPPPPPPHPPPLGFIYEKEQFELDVNRLLKFRKDAAESSSIVIVCK